MIALLLLVPAYALVAWLGGRGRKGTTTHR